MEIQEIIAALDTPSAKLILPAVTGAGGWLGNSIVSWWKGRDRYQAHVTWQSFDGQYGVHELPVLVIQSIHSMPINITRVRVRNGFRWKTDAHPYDSEDPHYPEMPIVVPPLQRVTISLNSDSLQKMAERGWFLRWLWVPRVYLGVETMGRGERIFVAEGGLRWDVRRKRYRR